MAGSGRLSWCTWLARFLFVAALAYFIFRGPYRFRETAGDLKIHYAASRAFLSGHDPYVFGNLPRAWRMAGNPPGLAHFQEGLPFLYLPSAFVTLVPFSLGSWALAKWSWLVAHLVGLGWLVVALIRRHKPTQAGALFFAAATLGLAPLQTCVGLGQASLTVLILCGLAFLQLDAERDVTAGVLFGLASCLKPHLTILYLIFYLLTGRIRAVVAAIVVLTLGMGTTVAWLWLNHLKWIEHFQGAMRAASAPGSINDPGPANPASGTIINLAVILTRFTSDERLILIVSVSCAGLLLLAGPLLKGWRSRLTRTDALQSFATVSAISLLPMYHRNYDASFLVFPIAWLIWVGTRTARGVSIALLVLISAFVLPAAKLLLVVGQQLPHAITASFAWKMALVHEAWIVLLVAVGMTILCARSATTGEQPRG